MKPFTSIRHIAAISVAAISLLLTAGCNGEENEPGGNTSNAAIITASVGKADNVASTRASETAWDAGDCIGISTSSTSTKGKTNYINIRYQTDGSVFSPVPGAAGEDNTILLPGYIPDGVHRLLPLPGCERNQARQQRRHHPDPHRCRPEHGKPARHRLPLGAENSPK